MGRQEDHKRQSAPDKTRLERLLSALPVTAAIVTPGGALIDPPAGHKAGAPAMDYIWELPAFSHRRDRAELFKLLGRAQNGESMQIERPYSAPGRRPDRRRGLLSLTPLLDEDGLVDLIALTLIDCEDHALPVLGPRDPSRFHAAQLRVENSLDLAQAVIETGYGLETSDELAMREALSARLHRLSACSDALAQLDDTQISTRELLDFALDDDNRSRLDCASDSDTVPIPLVPALSLLVSELAANAAEHGAWNAADGRVRLSLSRQRPNPAFGEQDAALVVAWTESGAVDAQEPVHEGFGLRYVRSCLRELYGARSDVMVAPDGYNWRITLPVPAESARAADDFARFDGGYEEPYGAKSLDSDLG